ncbi:MULTISPECIES: hypothetical protein [Streptomyces]|uniref:DUF11 domain-containing protein n=2 Tax=Streptomyces TaxID=1883 RepID=A0ABU4K2J9_9ACTN|nr:hypothetical protein [Streptomyces roseolus]MDX2291986.1 hypothetical protein [Streptomyces roseolus]
MRVISQGVLGAALAALVVMGAGTAAGAAGGVDDGAAGGAVAAAVGGVAGGAVAGAGGEAAGAEADLAHHGHVSLWDGRVGVWLVTENHGPSDVVDATVRLAFSAPMAGGQELPPGCLWSSSRVVSCRTGALPDGGAAGELALDLRAVGRPQELTVDVSTAWRAGGVDRNSLNDRHRVLVLATGDPYVF